MVGEILRGSRGDKDDSTTRRKGSEGSGGTGTLVRIYVSTNTQTMAYI